MARLERSNRRLFVLLVICLSIIAGMFAYETQFETVKIEAEQQADGDSNNYVAGGDYYGREAESDNQKAG